MTRYDLTKYQPSAAHREAVRKSGFDLNDPDRRHAPETQVHDRLKALSPGLVNTGPDPRAYLLMKARDLGERALGRGLCLLGPVLAITADRAEARRGPVTDHPFGVLRDQIDAPSYSANLDKPVEQSSSQFTDMFTVFADPFVTNALLAGLIAAALATILLLHIIRKEASMAHDLPRCTRHHPLGSLMADLTDQRRLLIPFEADSDVDDVEPPTANSAQDNWGQVDQTAIGAPPTFSLLVDGASRLGKVREENQDAYRHYASGPATVRLILCDGAGGVVGGREAAEEAVEAIDHALAATVNENPALNELDLEQAMEVARANASAKALTGITTGIVAAITPDEGGAAVLHYATLGDGALAVIWPDGMVTQVQTPHHVAGAPSNMIGAWIGEGSDEPSRIGCLRLEIGCIVMLMSDGASDLFPFEDYAIDRSRQIAHWHGNHIGYADSLLANIEAARDEATGAYLHHDNMTLVMAFVEGKVASDA